MAFNPMRVVRLEADHFKRIEAVDITPEGDVVQITGRNGAGKTSVLDAIWSALGGKAAAPAKPVNGDAEKEIVVTRKFTAAGTTSVTVESADGARYKSPQHLLDALVGSLSFDPFAFMRDRPRDQAEYLREICAIDTSALDGRRERLYENRTDANRELKRVEAQVGDFPTDVDTYPTEAPDTSAMAAELAAAHETNATIRGLDAERTALDRELNSLAQRIAELEREQLEKHERHAAVVEQLSQLEAVDTQAAEAAMSTATKDTQRADIRVRWVNATARRDEVKAEVEGLTSSIERVDIEKRELLEAAALPVDGLALADDHLTFGGIPLDQASMAEQLRVSVAIAMRANPTIRVIRIADGSLLDEASMEALRAMAGEHGYQVWIERVAEGPGVGIFIEDGSVAGEVAA